jgi:hypothetical protein
VHRGRGAGEQATRAWGLRHIYLTTQWYFEQWKFRPPAPKMHTQSCANAA